ncbi:MAG: 3-oxoacyl-[acyl-carrier-protein] synthase, KASI (EC [uncultured Aureispira sp.]|uniref:3-oxoacyl-[acyl-carrier-protein] synthase 1 n=1 Tax=uncultured Aureispira sp. TaxID=1331704 RepID=A0A6S6TKY4_9BACT|nr:MAG: 3-oxoacyl-[acyl-carrier-protein] synthase, KASI (EC [uncultured Aureispira sp.]
MNRVVITGMGIYSCLGSNLAEVKNSLYTGKSGIGIDPIRTEMGYSSALTGILPEPNLKKLLKRRMRIGMGQESRYAYMATAEALKVAGIDDAFLDNNIIGLLYGNDSTAQSVIEGIDKLRAVKDTALVGSGSIFKSMNSTITMNLSTIFRLKGINFTISAACASGSHSIGLGYMFIKQGLQSMVVCGGAQEVNAQAMGSFDGLGAFSLQMDDPTKASKPFDVNRDGLVPSGGGATIILESYESAVARGATILAEVIGYGFSSNGLHISQPSVEGPARSLKMALDQANVAASEIDYINAHATSTPLGDKHEAMAIGSIFGGDNCPYVSSTKSMTGHECWMAGASEIVYSLLMMQDSFIAPNINLENVAEEAKPLNLAKTTIDHKIDTFLSNSFGFGGTNSSLIVRKFK